MATDQDKLSKFFAKQDKKIQSNGYITINEIADKKHSRIQSVKMGSDKNKINDESNKSDDEWGQIDNEMSSSIGYLPTHTDLSIFKLIDQKRGQQQKQKESQKNVPNDTECTFTNGPKNMPVFNTNSAITKPSVDSGGNASVQPTSTPQETKPKPYQPGDLSRRKNVKTNASLSQILLDESEFPTL